ncbi:MAG: leucyl aminopeptidase [Planctomycetota bacterium]
MKINVTGGPELPERISLLAIPVLKKKRGAELDPSWTQVLPKNLRGALSTGDFSAKVGSSHLVHVGSQGPAERILLVGLGKKEALDGEVFRKYGGVAASTARNTAGARALVLLPGESGKLDRESCIRATAEGLAMGAYEFRRYKTDTPDDGRRKISSISLLLPDGERLAAARRALSIGQDVAYGVNLARDVGNTPGNDLGPQELAKCAQQEGRKVGLKVRVLDRKALEREKMGALLGVAQGSARPPTFTILEYKPTKSDKRPPLVFVGKAITFDSGGISIKPASGMEDMKYDMCGGGAVLGALVSIARLRPRRHVIGLIPSAENMPGAQAYRPGDVLTSASGLTIEVISTDAEGRLALADALHYSKRYKPDLVMDLATLTGACVVALGSVNSGLFTHDAALGEKVCKAGAAVGEKIWPMPLDEEYFELIKSSTADLRNSGGRRGGAITAAAFLSRFIRNHPWVHLDIAGTAWSTKSGPYHTKGATGVAVRTLVQLAETF